LALARAQGTTPEDLVRQALEPILKTGVQNPLETKPRRRISEGIAGRMKALSDESV